MSFVTSNNQKIFYHVHSHNGTPLVLIMGLGGTSDGWVLQLNDFSKEYTLITPDNRGAGRSAMPDEPYSMDIFADDLVAILDQEGIEQAIILGASMGGLIAQEFYHKYSERVKALVLACTGVGPNDPEFTMATQKVLDVLSTPIPEKEEELPPYLKDYTSVFYHHSYCDEHPDLVDKMIQKRSSQDQPDYANKRQLAACFTHTPNSSRLSTINVPTLVIHGDDDLVWPLDNARYLADNIEGAELKIMEKTGHMLLIERPEEFNQAILSFLTRNI